MSSDINQWGEYYAENPPRTPGEISELRHHNEKQDRLIRETRDIARDTYAGLDGVNGDDGLRGEFLTHQINNSKRQDLLDTRIDQLEVKIDRIIPKIVGSITAALGVIAAIVGIIAGVVKLWSG